MKRRYSEKNMSEERMDTVRIANQIIGEYQSQGYKLTLRQLYYQFVSRDLIPNTERSYKNLGSIISDGRLCGHIDWAAIEDRVRVPRVPQEFDDIEDLVEVALRAYRLPRWRGQRHYLELWVEKDALAGVLEPLASEFHITLMVNRGYSSQSAMYESAVRFKNAKAHELHLLYLGDHDPSGEDMVRDVESRLSMFGAFVEVTKIALTMDQVEEYQPPPNPAKMSDSRAAKYVAEHGDESWEVDALPPDVLSQLIRDAVHGIVDLEEMDKVKKQEEKDKKALLKATEEIMSRRKKRK